MSTKAKLNMAMAEPLSECTQRVQFLSDLLSCTLTIYDLLMGVHSEISSGHIHVYISFGIYGQGFVLARPENDSICQWCHFISTAKLSRHRNGTERWVVKATENTRHCRGVVKTTENTRHCSTETTGSNTSSQAKKTAAQVLPIKSGCPTGSGLRCRFSVCA
jgi:hypothetical protein